MHEKAKKKKMKKVIVQKSGYMVWLQSGTKIDTYNRV